MLVISIFSFSHCVFYCVKERNCHFSNAEFVVCKCIQFGRVQNFAILAMLNLSSANAFSLVVPKILSFGKGLIWINRFPKCSKLSFHRAGLMYNVTMLCGKISVRLYDVNTFSCFVGRNPNDQHTGSVTCVSTLLCIVLCFVN